VSLTDVRREFEVDGARYGERYFVADAIQGFVSELCGEGWIEIEPEFDLRFSLALNRSVETYEIEELGDGVLVRHQLPAGRYDDATETFLPDDGTGERTFLYAAVRVVGEETELEMLPPTARARKKVFRKDAQRHRFVTHTGREEAADHAPLWNQHRSQVFVPVRLRLRGKGRVIYGFGSSRDEALAQVEALAAHCPALRARKTEAALAVQERVRFTTANRSVDLAHAHVLGRVMDALVVREAIAPDTALARPATMILAGNQYFHDSWKRDENIALGFLLSLGFYDIARELIADTWQLQDPVTGRLPQRIRAGEVPPYHSSDGTLWALWRLQQYWRCSGDRSLLDEKRDMVSHFFRRSLARTVSGLLPSGRTTHPDYLWETWMDTPHTPRDGFPIEIQLLWLACLRVYRPIVGEWDIALAARMEAAERSAWAALERYNSCGILADSLDDRLQARDLLTPNGHFAFGLGLDLGEEMEARMRHLGRRELAGSQGIRTLAPRDWSRVLSPEFLADRRAVRGRRMRSVGKYNYHRGVEWNWLAQFFVRAELKYGEPDVAWRRYLRGQVRAALERGGIGGISELHDLSGTRGPEFQAWSMAGLLEALHAFAGIEIDVPARTIVIAPQLPEDWPGLSVRKWYGQTPFDLHASRREEGMEMRVVFPEEVPDARIDITFLVPAGHGAAYADVRLDGLPQSPAWQCEPAAGTGRERLRLSLPAAAEVDLSIGMRPRRAKARTATA
jgi:glycogen debranching enzyme